MNTTMSTSRRVFMYVAPVAVASIALNIPKFLETTTATSVEEGDNSTKTTEIKVLQCYVLKKYLKSHNVNLP